MQREPVETKNRATGLDRLRWKLLLIVTRVS